MTDLQATLDAIDQVAVHECGHCRRPLGPDSPSLDFCSPWCQADWTRANQEVTELVGYREPDDLAAHAYNLVELSSPETTPAWEQPYGIYETALGATDLRVTFTFDTSRFNAACDRASSAIDSLMLRFGDAYFQVVDEGPAVVFNRDWQPRGMDPLQAMSFGYREEPEPEVCETPELFGADFDFEHRPATTLPHEPPPAVMPALPERNWQALVDAHTSSGPERHRRAPRELGRRR